MIYFNLLFNLKLFLLENFIVSYQIFLWFDAITDFWDYLRPYLHRSRQKCVWNDWNRWTVSLYWTCSGDQSRKYSRKNKKGDQKKGATRGTRWISWKNNWCSQSLQENLFPDFVCAISSDCVTNWCARIPIHNSQNAFFFSKLKFNFNTNFQAKDLTRRVSSFNFLLAILSTLLIYNFTASIEFPRR